MSVANPGFAFDYQQNRPDPAALRCISNQGLRFRRDLVDYDIYSCWDANISADGIVYLGPISQYSTDLQAKLIAYDYARDKSYLCCDSKHSTLAGPRQLPHKETHESITFLPDGKVALTTHSTAASADQPEWLPFSHLHHSWAGFPGSNILVYDPVNGQVENWGIPVARETIYGMTYDARYNCLYLIGFMKGHVYRFSIEDRTVTDLGKAAEYYCYRLHPGPDGHIYGMTKSGYLWRINVDTASLEDLNWRHPVYPGNAFNNTWYRYLAYARNVSAHEFVFCSYTSDEFYLFDTRNCQVRSLGPKFTHAQHNNVRPSNFCQNEFALDRYGALWYMIQPVSLEHKSADEPYYFTIPSYLIYWDIKNNRLPQNLGLVSDNRSLLSYATAVCYDKERDILHLVGSNIRLQDNYTTLGICSIDLASFRPAKDEKGALCSYKPYQFSRRSPSEQESLRQKASASPYPLFIGEEFGKENPWQAFREDQVCPVRLWRHLPQGQLAAAAVIGLAWDQSGVLHGLCGAGQEPEFYFQITANDFTVLGKTLAEVSENPTSWLYQGILGPFQPQRRGKFLGIKPPPAFSYQLTDLRPFAELAHELKEWLAKSSLPKSSLPLEQDWPLPAVAGRAYLAKPSYWTFWHDSCIIAGSQDGLLGIIRPDQNVFALGNAAPFGPVRCLCTNASQNSLWGVAGDDEDIGMVFYFDDQIGICQLGHLIYNPANLMDGPSAANILSSIVLAPDGKMLAIGGADRLASVHIVPVSAARLPGQNSFQA